MPLLNYDCVMKFLNSTDMMVDDRPLKGNLLLLIISAHNTITAIGHHLTLKVLQILLLDPI